MAVIKVEVPSTKEILKFEIAGDEPTPEEQQIIIN